MLPVPSAGPVPSRGALALALLVAALGVSGCDSSTSTEPLSPNAAATAVNQVAEAKATVKVLATGLRFPRGFTFGGGNVYVAEAGSGGPNATKASQCDQVVPPVGPYTNGRTARISRIGPNGNRSTVAFGFPSAVNALATWSASGTSRSSAITCTRSWPAADARTASGACPPGSPGGPVSGDAGQ